MIFNCLIHSESHNLLVPAQVVDQVCQGVVGCVPRKTDHSAGHSVKALFHVPEHMFHPHAQLRVLFVDGLLPFADFLASGVTLDHLVLHPELPHHPLHPFADVGALLLLGGALFRIPQLAAPVFLDYFVLFACVVLARCLHEAPVYHGALMQDQVVLLQAVCMLVWSDSLSFLICGKYTNNSLNDNGLRENFIIKSSSVAS